MRSVDAAALVGAKDQRRLGSGATSSLVDGAGEDRAVGRHQLDAEIGARRLALSAA